MITNPEDDIIIKLALNHLDDYLRETRDPAFTRDILRRIRHLSMQCEPSAHVSMLSFPRKKHHHGGFNCGWCHKRYPMNAMESHLKECRKDSSPEVVSEKIKTMLEEL